MSLWKLGCRWGSNTPLFYDFIKENNIVIGWGGKTYNIGDWLLITDGFSVLAFANVMTEPKTCLNYPQYQNEFLKLKIPFQHELFVYKAEWIVLKREDQFNYDLQQGIARVQNYEIKIKFKSLLNKYKKAMDLEKKIEILKNKKQIILQGPPGTGKTYTAKKLAERLTENYSTSLSEKEFVDLLKVGAKIPNASGTTDYYTIKDVSLDKVTLGSEKAQQDWSPKFNQIKIKFDQLLINEVPSNKNALEPYELAVAKYLFNKLNSAGAKNNFYQLIQFHPSYTYEDFVRGITAKSTDGIIEYKTEDKIFAQFAKKALKNYNDSKKEQVEISKEKWVNEQFEKFVDFISDDLEKNGKIVITDSVNIVKLDFDAFRYKGIEGWTKNGNRMLFNDIKQAYLDENNERQDIKHNQNLSGLANWHASYYIRILDLFKKFLLDKSLNFVPSTSEKEELKNFVLIIDEINRANLPSVLGELIYALEYRGKKVESMYDIDGDNSLIIPPNLLIIGTMNTADRSVGHIDYAIRRRFAFVDILPDPSVIENEIAKALFKEISELFNSRDTLASDFKPEQVQLGHSYFIVNNDGELQLKVNYEIIPILEEYLKDGILLEKAEKIIVDLKARFEN
ncbi:AAA family ATPase [Flavobacterium lipolyticum]|uniref:AAA family ATPase n=1 Tax=Flavobacterium lipolyticum TaxID=2893754 RepID=A0ABS8M3X0_9FLAO|nr:AAA family ATPase [Flavobacterium sp. F-126]MCC9018906.1 AAA family ATPase [Flavobacterium sp. F-126]